jgi:hypothetical protein
MRFTGGGAFCAAATLISLSTLVPAPARAGSDGEYSYCPPARASASHLHWHWRRLAPGVSLASATMRGDRGKVEVRALRANLAHRGVSVSPLHGALASGRSLTRLAAARRLVGATNAMFFNLTYSAPRVPFIKAGRPMVLSDRPERVAGIGVDRRAEDGDVWLAGSVRSRESVAPLAAVNEPYVPSGVSVYTASWGHRRIPLPSDARSRVVRGSTIHSPVGRHLGVPRGGRLLVARGGPALDWLRSLPGRSRLGIRMRAETDAPVRFDQAYGVGTHTVAAPDQISTGLYCNRHEFYAARTGIAWTRSRSVLLLVTAESPHGPDHYGLDENQMSAVLVGLRAASGYALDGGYSTTMVARLRQHHHRLALVTAPRGNRQRAIPVGVGVYYRR